MGGYRIVKHVYDDNWEDKNQFRTREASEQEEEIDSLFDSYDEDDDE
jgi:hypothetical protein